MDDLEKAVLISFDASGTPAFKAQAVAYIQQIKESPLICRICIDKLLFCKLVQVQFWCLQSLHDVLRVKYSSIAPEEKSFIRKSLFSMACYETANASDDNAVRILDAPPFIKNKLAQVFVTLIYFEYPSVWPSFFVDFIANLGKGANVIDMFCRILSSLDEELISLEYPRKKDEIAIAGNIKDAMRAQCVGQIASAWYNIVTLYKNVDPELCCCVLNCMKGYIAWIDIGFIINDAFTRLLFELVLTEGSPDQLRAATADVFLAVVLKGMDSKNKLSLLHSLQLRRVFGLVEEDNDTVLFSSVASLLTGYATELLECSQCLSIEADKELSFELLNEVLPSVFHIIQNYEVDSAFSIVKFLSDYVGTMKGLHLLKEVQTLHIGKILEVIRAKIQYDPTYRNNLDLLDKIGRDEEERMVEFRKDFFVLLRNVARVAPDLTHMFIRNSLVRAISSSEESSVEEVEAALSLVYELGESLSDEAMRNENSILQEMLQILLSTRFPCHFSRIVALMYLDTVTRYLKLILENTQYIPIALHAFLDERGICHPNSVVSRRAGYLFMRAVKILRPKLVPYTEAILQSLQDMITQFTKMSSTIGKELPGSEDGSHIFEAIGLLIGMEELAPEKQSNYLSSLLTPLGLQVEKILVSAKSQNHEELSPDIRNVHQIIVAIIALSKGFSPKLVIARPTISLLFKQVLEIVLDVLVVFPKVELLRSKVTSFIHRMVEILGVSVLSHLPRALEQLVTVSEPKDLVGFLVLLNQLICKFGATVHGMLEEVYPVIASKVLNALQKIDNQVGSSSCPEEIRELQELQKLFITFLHVIATRNLSSVFITSKSSQLLESMMQLVLYSCCNHKDIPVRKACVQIFIQLIKDWCIDHSGKEKVPGFQNFVLEAFALNCCLYSVLDKSFDFQDANTLSLFGEILTAQMVMYERLSNAFLLHFVSKGLANVHCPRDFSEEYCQKLQGNDPKSLKSVYQSLIENLRLQQNGSLVFR